VLLSRAIQHKRGQCRRGVGIRREPIQITGVSLFVGLQINTLRPNPSHSATESQALRFSVNIVTPFMLTRGVKKKNSPAPSCSRPPWSGSVERQTVEAMDQIGQLWQFSSTVPHFFPWLNRSWWATASSLSRLYSGTQYSVGFIRKSDQPDAKTCTWRRTTFTRDRHPCPGGIRTRKASKRGVAEPRLRPCGNWDRHRAWC